ncbi:ABC transporter substrate-binding protein [Bradyrhizobium barranii]|nr:ABC transporter substrate-binding protein [Bradyrhizobium barranii]WFT91916.1 ABC transporter substrate-binding protein [Bradyrhizobium barranii]
MRRREFLVGIAGLLLHPSFGIAQPAGSVPVVGVLWHAGSAEEEKDFATPLRAGFADLGYIEGKTIKFEERFPAEQKELFDRMATELVDAKVNVIVAGSIPAALAAQRATSLIPIVLVANPDPIGLKLVASLSRPGGNITGLSSMGFDLAVKRLEVVREVIPAASRIALLVNPYNPYDGERQASELLPSAQKLGLVIKAFEAKHPEQLQPVIEQIAAEKFDAIIITQNAMFYNERKRLAQLGRAYRIATMAPADLFLDAGAVMSYGPVWSAMFRNAARYVDKILKGANPAELPVQQPTQFRFVINLKAAKAIDLEIPPIVVSRADEVME